MASSKVSDFFNRRFFEIPKYQRGFAWERRNVRELFDDIFEAIETESSHYIGTFVLSENAKKDDHFFIVDGQQRITTITMIIREVIKYLDSSDAAFFRRFYVEEDARLRLTTLGKDNDYFSDLLRGCVGEPENKSQRLLKSAHEEIETAVASIDNKTGFLRAIEKLEIMEFIEKSEGDAIRIFLTVNDRGKPLSNMEKAKSLLIYFSNKYLKKKLDNKINDHFGEIFEIYDDIKHIGETQGINLISSRDFNEDNIMRYHFVVYSDENYDATAPYVLRYLKRELTEFRNEDKQNDFRKMETLINDYVESLYAFFSCLRRIMRKVLRDEKYYKMFVILGLSATLYPLIVKLEMLGRLERKLPSRSFRSLTFFDLVESIDVRVYKTRGTDPRAEISRFTYKLDDTWTDTRIQNWLVEYNRRWMSREEFQTNLSGYIYRNRALPHIFVDYCENLEGREFALDELRKISAERPTIEHVLSQTPKFSFKSAGFENREEFLEYEHTLGNLTVLERELNSAAQNKVAVNKIPIYDRSIFRMTRELASFIDAKDRFGKAEIEKRTKELSEYLMQKWRC